MITTPQDYQELLYLIQDVNRQTQAILLPKDEIIYEVDLNSRTIQAPEFLSIVQDHNAETIYFKVNRYFDNVDLSNMTCVFCFQNANPDKYKNGFVYPVPFIDIETFKDENKMLLPWVIEGPATAFAGTVTFSIQFYKVEKVLNGMSEEEFEFRYGRKFNAAELAQAITQYIYNLNTLPAHSEVKYGIGDILVSTGTDENGNPILNENYSYDVDTVLDIYQRLTAIEQSREIYWLEMV